MLRLQTSGFRKNVYTIIKMPTVEQLMNHKIEVKDSKEGKAPRPVLPPRKKKTKKPASGRRTPAVAPAAPAAPAAGEAEEERQQLVYMLRNALAVNPDLLQETVDVTSVQQIEQMSTDELHARLIAFKRGNVAKVSDNINERLIMIVDSIIGKVLGCGKELRSINAKDKALHESTKASLGDVILFIPPHIRTAIFYAINVAKAVSEVRLGKENVAKGGSKN
jgi:hypothetical protein